MITISLRFLNYKAKTEDSLQVNASNTGEQLLDLISERNNIPRRAFRVIFNGKPVKGGDDLRSLGIVDGSQLKVLTDASGKSEYIAIARSILGTSRTDEQLNLFALHLEKSLSKFVDRLSLDDIERYATATS